MRITNSTLLRGAAIAAVISGTAYIGIQFFHPADVIASISTESWRNVHLISFAQAVLALVGFTGVYLRQVREFGLLGLIGFLMLGLFFILQSAFTFAESLIAPLLAASAPQLATDIVGLFGRYEAVSDLGALAAEPNVGAALYVLGALVLGVAVIRARVLHRGAGILLIAAAVVTPVAGILLPHALERMAAVPMGAAFIWLGVSLWDDQRPRRVALRNAVSQLEHTSAA